MNLTQVDNTLIRPALSLLPDKMDSPQARVMLLAIGQQESRFVYRRQIHGPAMGFWMFETAGIEGVLRHHSSADNAALIASTLNYKPLTHVIYDALPDNGLLAAVLARLLLWTDPYPLPDINDVDGGWNLYQRTWRPGRPRRETWDALHAKSVTAIGGQA